METVHAKKQRYTLVERLWRDWAKVVRRSDQQSAAWGASVRIGTQQEDRDG